MGKGALTTYVDNGLRERVLARCRERGCGPSEYLRGLILRDFGESNPGNPGENPGLSEEALARLIKESIKSALAEALPKAPEKPPEQARPQPQEVHLPHYLKVALERCPECRAAMGKFIDEHLSDAMSKIIARFEKLEKKEPRYGWKS